MDFLITLFLVLFLSFLLFWGAEKAGAAPPGKAGAVSVAGEKAKGNSWMSRLRGWFKDQPYSAETDKGKGKFTKAELTKRLKALAVSKKPSKDSLAMGAMCYEMAMPTGTRDVICSHCSTKSVFKNGWQLNQIEDCQRLIQAIKKAKRPLDVTLDTRFYCYQCNPKLKESDVKGAYKAPEISATKTKGQVEEKEPIDNLYLIIKYTDGKESRRAVINTGTLRALLAFVQGSDRIKGMTGTETPLKDWLPKLQELLAITDL